MGREVRRVPPNWKHPMEYKAHGSFAEDCYKPLAEADFYELCAQDWIKGFLEWQAGTHVCYEPGVYFWEYEELPSRDSVVAYKTEDATWYQVYETVSDGTPVTPPFETERELIEYLYTKGTFWDDGPWNRDSAEKFVKLDGFRPSAVFENGVFKTPKDQ